MAAKQGKPRPKQLSRGQRKHVRRVKQEARHTGAPYRPPFGPTRPSGIAKKDAPPT
jgi:hypothetical protein